MHAMWTLDVLIAAISRRGKFPCEDIFGGLEGGR